MQCVDRSFTYNLQCASKAARDIKSQNHCTKTKQLTIPQAKSLHNCLKTRNFISKNHTVSAQPIARAYLDDRPFPSILTQRKGAFNQLGELFIVRNSTFFWLLFLCLLPSG